MHAEYKIQVIYCNEAVHACTYMPEYQFRLFYMAVSTETRVSVIRMLMYKGHYRVQKISSTFKMSVYV